MKWTDVIAIIISVVAVAVSAWGLRHAKASADAARRSAEAAERQAAAAEAALPPPPSPVAWQVVHRGAPNSYLLRNAGTEPAVSLEIHDEDGLVRASGEASLSAVRLSPGQSLGFWVATPAELPEVTEIRARWEGSDGWVVIPLP
ncbi:hypothetical protein [Micromonospora sp. KC213]|uniref:hypothetical protein n=1 Tax=Micromonospora sp. KC213 TaxID=2530378 RepID=UPI00104C03A5|nr:hypothetical protein [Micromonospora sp. KC213]TDC42075.1 hypothetical protein E1166_08940 [Micromonospora sp. KC213]